MCHAACTSCRGLLGRRRLFLVFGLCRDAKTESRPVDDCSPGQLFIGGREVKSDTLSTLPAYAPSGTITVDQMYVRYQVPAGQLGVPITLIHGCCLTGKTGETTPDGLG